MVNATNIKKRPPRKRPLQEEYSGSTTNQTTTHSMSIERPERYDDYDTQRMTNVLVLEKQAKPITGTLSEKHLIQDRKIISDQPFPADIRHLQSPYYANKKDKDGDWVSAALVGLARDSTGEMIAVHRCFLDEYGHKAFAVVQGEEKDKAYDGWASGAGVLLRPPMNGWMALCEGLAT